MTTTDHTHDWVHDPQRSGGQGWVCTSCAETSATCGTCDGPTGTSLLLCPRCERAAADVLAGIAHALGQYEPDPRSPVKSPGDMHLVPLGPGGGLCSPGDIESELWSWVARWTEHSGADNAAPLDYLRSRHVWAAHNVEASGWPAYLEAMRTLRATARRIAGLLPKRLAEPCVLCGGTVVQDWSDEAWIPNEHGLSDTVRCTRCRTTWNDRTHWRDDTMRQLAALPGLHPDALITLAQARLVWPDVPAATWRKWAQRWRDDGDQAIERAWSWWYWRCEHAAGRRPPHAPEGWPGPGEAPSLPGWMPERGERYGVPVYRAGDLQGLVLRWARRAAEVVRQDAPA